MIPGKEKNMRTRHFIALLGIAVLCSFKANAVELAAVPTAIHIEPQPLRAALAGLAEQTGVQIMRREEDASADGMMAPRVVGQLSVREALDQLLAKTGLTCEFLNERTVRIVRVP